MATLRTRPPRPPNRFWIVKEELEEPGVDPKRTQSLLVYCIFGVLFLVVGTLFVHHLSQDQKARPPVSIVRGHGQPTRRPRPTVSPTRATRPPRPTGVTIATRPAGTQPLDVPKATAALPADLLSKPVDATNWSSRLASFTTLAKTLDDASRRALFGASSMKEIQSWLDGPGKEARLQALLLRLRLVEN